MQEVERIRKALGIKAEAVGVRYTDDLSTAKPAEGKYTVCDAILEAADGKVIMISVEKIQGIADAIDKSTAGTAKPSKEFEKVIVSIRPAKNRGV